MSYQIWPLNKALDYSGALFYCFVLIVYTPITTDHVTWVQSTRRVSRQYILNLVLSTRSNIEAGFDLQVGNDIWPVVSYLDSGTPYLGCCNSLAMLTGYISGAAHCPPLNTRSNA